MKTEYKEAVEKLASMSWDVRLHTDRMPCPENVLLRYDWLPKDIVAFLEETKAAVSPDNKSWFNTSTDLSGQSGVAFLWNQWEFDSLAAADNYPKLQLTIRAFWDQHFPIMISVKNGYAYFAIQRDDLAIVCGEEPEYEEASTIAASFADFLNDLSSANPRISRWV
jgi:hypothetical protein